MRQHFHFFTPRIKATSTQHRYLVKPTPPTHPLVLRSKLLRVAGPTGLPPAWDLRSYDMPPRDQGAEGSCTGFGGTGWRECNHNVAMNNVQAGQSAPPAIQKIGFRLSPAFLYYEERLAEGDPNSDNGAMIADTMATMEAHGVCPEDSMPYVAGQFAVAPSNQSLMEAVDFRIGVPSRVDMSNQNNPMAVISANRPILIAIQVYQSFEDGPNPAGLLPVPDTSKEGFLGGHCIYISAYDNEGFWIKNSWGTGWGVGGYAKAPWAYLQFVDDAWTAAPIIGTCP